MKTTLKMSPTLCSPSRLVAMLVATLTTLGLAHAGPLGLHTSSATPSSPPSSPSAPSSTLPTPVAANRFHPLPPRRIVAATSTERSIAAELLQPTLPNIVSDLNEDYDTLERRRRIQVGLCEVGCLKDMNIRSSTVADLDSKCLLQPECTKCWRECDRIKNQPPPPLWPVHIASMVKQEFLVATNLAWKPSKSLRNCFVTWEVAGGGLVGNLLTDANSAELSLWPDTKYRVQVTCKSRNSGKLVKSPTLIVNTSHAISMKPDPATPSSSQSSSSSLSDDDDALIAHSASPAATADDTGSPISPIGTASSSSSSSSSNAALSNHLKQRILQDSQPHTPDDAPHRSDHREYYYTSAAAADDDRPILISHHEFFLGILAAIFCFFFVGSMCTMVQQYRSRCRPSAAKSQAAHLVAVCSDDDR